MVAFAKGRVRRDFHQFGDLVRWALSTLLLVVALTPRPVLAFDEQVHRELTRLALDGKIKIDNLTMPDKADMVGFYRWFGYAMAMGGDEAGKVEFQSHFPGQEDFGAIGVRRFLGLSEDPSLEFWGISKFETTGTPERFNTLIRASALPDEDRRNQNRYAYDAEGKQMKLPDGRAIPADPAVLNMGRLSGSSSQAHAHYQLSADNPSAEVETLQDEPWNFTVAAGFGDTVQTFGAEMAQTHLDMAILARVWGESEFKASGEYLALLWLGAGLHYVQDAAGPLHNVQVGSYEIFRRAKVDHWIRAVLSGGGFLFELPSFEAIGLGYLRNYHRLGERWLADQFDLASDGKQADPMVLAAINAAAEDEAEFATRIDTKIRPFLNGPDYREPWEDGRGAGNLIVEELAAVGSRQGGALYTALAEAGASSLSSIGYELPEHGPCGPELWADVSDPAVVAAKQRIAEIQAASVRRATTAARRYFDAYVNGNADSAARRLRIARLRGMSEATSRREAFVANPPPAAMASVHDPLWFLVTLLVVAVLLWLALRLSRGLRRRSGTEPDS